jgi:hypothetical protein
MKKPPKVIGIIIIFSIAITTQCLAQSIINGCYDKHGNLRIVTNSNDCKDKETFISWNQKGPEGPAGAAGATGPQGVAGISFDLSKLYTVTSNYAPAFCKNDDVSISCTAICSTHPDFPSPPLPFPLYGVPEEVINGQFGINFNEEKEYAYEDHQPGTCVAKCVVPPGDPGLPTGPPYPETYTPIIRVLCMPRD